MVSAVTRGQRFVFVSCFFDPFFECSRVDSSWLCSYSVPHFEQYVCFAARTIFTVGSLKPASKRHGRLEYSVLQDSSYGLGALAGTL